MRSNFWDSKNKDRRYNAGNWAEYFAQFISNGVYANPATSMQVQADGGRNVRLAVGSCFIKGRTGYAEGDDVLTLDFGGGGPRIDRIVARLDVPNREIQPYVIKGEVAETPTSPDIVRDGTYFDLCLAEITVPANATEITQADIADVRGNNEVCGFVTGLIKQIDTADFFAQFTAEWALLRAACAQDEEAVIAAWAALNTTKSVNGVVPVDGNVSVTLDDVPDGEVRRIPGMTMLLEVDAVRATAYTLADSVNNYDYIVCSTINTSKSVQGMLLIQPKNIAIGENYTIEGGNFGTFNSDTQLTPSNTWHYEVIGVKV